LKNEENVHIEKLREIVWARGMYYHVSEKKLMYSRPVWESYSKSVTNAINE